METNPTGGGDEPTIRMPIVNPPAPPPVDPGLGSPPPPIPPEPGTVPPDEEPPGKGRLIAIVLAVFVIGLIIGGLIIYFTRDTGSKTDTVGTTTSSSSTTSSTTTSTSSTTTTKPTSTSSSTTSSTTKPAVPVINNFTVPATADCTLPSPVQLSVSWNASDATEVSISIDGPGVYKTYPGGSGADAVPFSCPGPHTYLLTAKGPGGTATKTVTVTKK
jgi:cytoskeletal protein RodZ